jgi:hypothetical protein
MAYPDDLDYAADSSVWNDTETCTYFSKTSEQVPATGVQIAGTVWFMVKKDFLPPGSPLHEVDLTVELPGRNMGAVVPKINDIIRRDKDGTFWTVKPPLDIPAGVDYRLHLLKSTKR